MSIYERLPEDFYGSSLHSLNPITRHYHGSRYARIREFVSAGYKKGMKILDIGCGSADWNTMKLPLTGLDGNERMLAHGRRMGYLSETISADIERTPLPVKDRAFDIIVASEVLEHLAEPLAVLKEARRALKKGGRLIATVPRDTPLSPWSVLFGMNCLIKGDLLGDGYYKRRCGHIQHFSEKSLSKMLEAAGFKIKERNVTLLNIALVAE